MNDNTIQIAVGHQLGTLLCRTRVMIVVQVWISMQPTASAVGSARVAIIVMLPSMTLYTGLCQLPRFHQG